MAVNASEKGAMSVDEFCAWASISRAKFYREIGAGNLKLRKIGRKSVIVMSDARAWLNALPEATKQEAA